METVSDLIIDALGGTTAVSRKAEIPCSTVHSWRTNGIPKSRRAHLNLIAAAEGQRIDWETGRLEAGDCGTADHADADTIPLAVASSGKSARSTAQVLA